MKRTVLRYIYSLFFSSSDDPETTVTKKKSKRSLSSAAEKNNEWVAFFHLEQLFCGVDYLNVLIMFRSLLWTVMRSVVLLTVRVY